MEPSKADDQNRSANEKFPGNFQAQAAPMQPGWASNIVRGQATTLKNQPQTPLNNQKIGNKLSLRQSKTKRFDDEGSMSRRDTSPARSTSRCERMTIQVGSQQTQQSSNPQTMRQSKTRNSLQSHVVSQNARHPKQVIVGQPYISFKKDFFGGQLSNKTKQLADLLEKQHGASNKKIKGKSPFAKQSSHQRVKQSQLSRHQSNNFSLESDSTLIKQQSRRCLQETNFSDVTEMEPASLRTKRQESGEYRTLKEGASQNCVVNVIGAANSQKPTMRQQKHQQSSWQLGLQNHLTRTGGVSPYKVPAVGGGQKKSNKTKSSEAIECQVLPIAILDQEHVTSQPLSTIASRENLGGIGFAPSPLALQLQEEGSGRKLNQMRTYSHQKLILDAHRAQISPRPGRETIDVTLLEKSKAGPRVLDGKKTSFARADDLPLRISPHPIDETAGSVRNEDIFKRRPSHQPGKQNLSAYQSQQAVERLKSQAITAKKSSTESVAFVTESGQNLSREDASSRIGADGKKTIEKDFSELSQLSFRGFAQLQQRPSFPLPIDSKQERRDLLTKQLFGGAKKGHVATVKLEPINNMRYLSDKQGVLQDQCKAVDKDSTHGHRRNISTLSKKLTTQSNRSSGQQHHFQQPSAQKKENMTQRPIPNLRSTGVGTSSFVKEQLAVQSQASGSNEQFTGNLRVQQTAEVTIERNQELHQDRNTTLIKQEGKSASIKSSFGGERQKAIFIVAHTEVSDHNFGFESTNQTNLEEQHSTFNNSAVSVPRNLLTPSKRRAHFEGSSRKQQSPHHSAVEVIYGRQSKQSSSICTAHPDLLPYVKAQKARKNFQTMDRKKQPKKGTLSPIPDTYSSLKLNQIGGPSRANKLKVKEGLVTMPSQKEQAPIGSKLDASMSRAPKQNFIKHRQSSVSNADSFAGDESKRGLVSPSRFNDRDVVERTYRGQRLSQRKLKEVSSKTIRVIEKMGISTSVTSLPRIVNEQRSSIYAPGPNPKTTTQKYATSKNASVLQNNSPLVVSQNLQSQAVQGIMILDSNQDSSLTPKNINGNTAGQMKENQSLKKATKSFSVLKQNKLDDRGTQLPKLRKQVSIREEFVEEFSAAAALTSDGSSVNHSLREKRKQLDRGEDSRSKQIALQTKKRSLPDRKHAKSYSQVVKSKNQNENSPHLDQRATVRANDQQRLTVTTSNPCDVSESRQLSLKSSQEDERAADPNGGLETTSNDEADFGRVKVGVRNHSEESRAAEHQIRIEISKTEVLDAMKKEHSRDLSLLYYDFNNSKARLMSKMKKMSDFVIQEEAEADGERDAPHPDSPELAQAQGSLKFEPQLANQVAKSPTKMPFVKNSVELKSVLSQGQAKEKQKLSQEQLSGRVGTVSSSAKGLLEIPSALKKTDGQLSQVDVNQSQTEIDFVNKKIDKAKLSISQLQGEGGLRGMHLQSPARLAYSRNSSTKTLKQPTHQSGAGDDTKQEAEASHESPPQKSQKKIFFANQSNHKDNFDARHRSPYFGSVKNSQANAQDSVSPLLYSIENNKSLAQSGSQSVSSLRQESQIENRTPFIMPQNQLAAISRRSNQERVSAQNAGCTGATGDEPEKGALQSSIKQGMGTGYQTSTTVELGSGSQKKRQNVGKRIRRLPSLGLGSPIPKNALHRRQSQDSVSGQVTESDLAVASSQHILEAESNLQEEPGRTHTDDGKVFSVIAFVKENKLIWE